jgi:hypothetical protein
VIYTDGACKGNPGPGGWGVLLQAGDAKKELFGGERETTNNRMELQAVIEALSALKRPCDVTLYLDSQYVRKGITEWIHGWKAKGWRTASKEPVKNASSGSSWTRWSAAPATASTGAGSRATPETRAMNAPTPWPTRAWTRHWGGCKHRGRHARHARDTLVAPRRTGSAAGLLCLPSTNDK